MAEERYHDEIFFGDDALSCKSQLINKKMQQMYIADSGYMLNIVNSLKKYSKHTRMKNSTQDSKQESDDGIASRRLEGIPEKRW